MKKILFYCLLIPFTFLGCASLKSEKPVIQGMIYNNENEAVSDVSIMLNGEEVAVSDIYGHFSLDKLLINDEYELTARKKNYEDSTVSFRLLNPSQLIYLRMYSSGELLTLAEQETAKKEYHNAENYLLRAEKAGGSFLSINYLRAIIFFQKGEYSEALDVAESLITQGYSEYYVYLLAADIYEKGFHDMEHTEIYLQKALDLSYDPEVQKRLSDK